MINILYCTNENYAKHCAASIESIKANNCDVRVTIKIASNNLVPDTKKSLEGQSKGWISVECVDCPSELLNKMPNISSYSTDIYMRLWVDLFFPEAQKVLYLDADTIVVDRLQELWDVNLGANTLAAVNIPSSNNHFEKGIDKGLGYFNSGVLLFNMLEWKKADRVQQVKDYLSAYPGSGCPDQDALNFIFENETLRISGIYNAISPYFRHKTFKDYVSKDDLVFIRENVVVVHFNGGARPWVYGCNHPYQKVYLRYLKRTAWAETAPKPNSFIDVFKKHFLRLTGIDDFVFSVPLKGK